MQFEVQKKTEVTVRRAQRLESESEKVRGLVVFQINLLVESA